MAKSFIQDAIERLIEANSYLRNSLGQTPLGPIAVGDTSQLLLPPVDPENVRVAVIAANTGNIDLFMSWDADAVADTGFKLTPGDGRLVLLVTQGELHIIAGTAAGSTVTLQEFTKPA